MGIVSHGREHTRTFRHAHLFSGIGGGAKGFNLAQPRVGHLKGEFVCAGGIDSDAKAIANFERETGVPGTVLDLFSLEQYISFFGKPPAPDWREAGPEDVFAAFGDDIDVAFTSAPCKGFSGLLSAAKSKTDKYQALNRLTVRGMWLLLEAYKHNPIPVILFENVPRIQTRGRPLLEEIITLLRAYGYIVNEDVHDCGKIGRLAQTRQRFLLIARHPLKVPPFVYQPPVHKLRGVGEVIGKLPLPGDPVGGVHHRIPALQWQTWVRLAFVEAGKDWRSLNNLRVDGGVLADYGIVPEGPGGGELRDNALGVYRWDEPAGTVIGNQRSPLHGRHSVADPRPNDMMKGGLGVVGYDETAGTVLGESMPTNGKSAVADPRIETSREGTGRLGVRAWDESAGTVAGANRPENGAYSVADPRPGYGPETHRHVLGVKGWEDSAGTISGSPKPTSGPNAVADPRPVDASWNDDVLGVRPWEEPSGTIPGRTAPSNGTFSVADPRVDGHERSVQLGVRAWDRPAPCVKGDMSVGTGPYAVSDPRLEGGRFNNVFRIVPFDAPAPAISGPGGAGGLSVADPRMAASDYAKTKYKVTPWADSSRAVIGASTTGDGAFAVADPRGGDDPDKLHGKYRVEEWEGEPARAVIAGRDNGAFAVQDPRAPGMPTEGKREHYQTGGHYGVVPWEEPSNVVSAAGRYDNSFASVADPRDVDLDAATIMLPEPKQKLVCRIVALDGTWHRPFTTLDLASLQSLFDPEEAFFQDEAGTWRAREGFELVGGSDSMVREWIGNAVPTEAARAMATTIGETLLLAWAGEGFTLSTREIWVKPGALALAVDSRQPAFEMDMGRL